MDVATTANEVTAALTPLLPILTAAVDTAQQRIGEQVGEAGVEWARRLWARLTGANTAGARPAELQAAAEQAAATPRDPDTVAALRWQVRRTLEADDGLRKEVEELLAQAPPTIALGARSVAIGGTTRNTTIVTGDHNTLE
jgi:hypothetical protein